MTRTTLRTALAAAPAERPFLVLAEFLPEGGQNPANIARFLADHAANADALPAGFSLVGVMLPQSPNGVPALGPAEVFAALDRDGKWPGLDVIPHVTAKDHNRDGIHSGLIGLRTLGIETLLALTGDKPAAGTGVFDVDSTGLIEIVRELDLDAYQRAKPGHLDRVKPFFVLAAVSPFKYTEGSARQQYLKMAKKIRSGADALITQMGWDSRKSEEIFRVLRDERIDVPVFGNVYLLSTTTPAPRLMAEGKLPGCVVTRELFDRVSSERLDGHIERAALQAAMYRDLGAAGVDVGGIADHATLVRILARAAEIGSAWRERRADLDFGVKRGPDGAPGYYLYDPDGRRREPSKPRATLHKKTFDLMHRALLTHGRGLSPAITSLLGASRSLRTGRGGPYRFFLANEKGVKSLLYSCEACGDCHLPEDFSRCSLGECAKGMPNPPCGDADSEGMCGHDVTLRCVGERIYDEAASEGPAGLDRLARTINPPRIAALDGTASLLNHIFEKDHARPFNVIAIAENLHASIPKMAAAMQEVLDAGPGALDRPGPARDYILAQVKAQVRHGAAYLDVNVDAFGESDIEFRKRLMREYVHFIRRHGEGVPVSVDSGSADVLRAGLEAWYEDAPAGIGRPLLNSLKTYTMDAFLPLREKLPFRFIGLLVDQKSTGSEGSYYSVDELHTLARQIFEAAVGRHGFKPEDIFFDSTVFPLSIDMPMAADTPGYTYRTFETIRRIKRDPAMKGVHLSLGVTNAVRDLPGRRTGVCRAYLAKAMEYGLDAGIINVLHDYGSRPPAPELTAFVDIFAKQDGSAEASQKAITAMMDFCKANRKIR